MKSLHAARFSRPDLLKECYQMDRNQYTQLWRLMCHMKTIRTYKLEDVVFDKLEDIWLELFLYPDFAFKTKKKRSKNPSQDLALKSVKISWQEAFLVDGSKDLP